MFDNVLYYSDRYAHELMDNTTKFYRQNEEAIRLGVITSVGTFASFSAGVLGKYGILKLKNAVSKTVK